MTNLLTTEELAQLAAVDTPTVANVIELFGIQSRAAGFANDTFKAVYPDLPPAVGYAVTATFRAGYPGNAAGGYSGLPELFDLSQSVPAPRFMVFQDLDEPVRAATYGELMATAFQRFGFSGLITSGAGRDLEQVRGLNFPCWTTGMMAAHGYCRIEESGVPVTIGGLKVHTGDLIHADGNGIVRIPGMIASTVASLCMPYIEAEKLLLDYLNGPDVTPHGYRIAMGSMKSAIAALEAQAKATLNS